MITLKVEPYCEDCDQFEAATETTEIYSDSEKKYCDTMITCANRRKCKELFEHIMAKGRKNEGSRTNRT